MNLSQSVQQLPGIGPRRAEFLATYRIHNIADLLRTPVLTVEEIGESSVFRGCDIKNLWVAMNWKVNAVLTKQQHQQQQEGKNKGKGMMSVRPTTTTTTTANSLGSNSKGRKDERKVAGAVVPPPIPCTPGSTPCLLKMPQAVRFRLMVSDLQEKWIEQRHEKQSKLLELQQDMCDLSRFIQSSECIQPDQYCLLSTQKVHLDRLRWDHESQSQTCEELDEMLEVLRNAMNVASPPLDFSPSLEIMLLDWEGKLELARLAVMQMPQEIAKLQASLTQLKKDLQKNGLPFLVCDQFDCGAILFSPLFSPAGGRSNKPVLAPYCYRCLTRRALDR